MYYTALEGIFGIGAYGKARPGGIARGGENGGVYVYRREKRLRLRAGQGQRGAAYLPADAGDGAPGALGELYGDVGPARDYGIVLVGKLPHEAHNGGAGVQEYRGVGHEVGYRGTGYAELCVGVFVHALGIQPLCIAREACGYGAVANAPYAALVLKLLKIAPYRHLGAA